MAQQAKSGVQEAPQVPLEIPDDTSFPADALFQLLPSRAAAWSPSVLAGGLLRTGRRRDTCWSKLGWREAGRGGEGRGRRNGGRGGDGSRGPSGPGRGRDWELQRALHPSPLPRLDSPTWTNLGLCQRYCWRRSKWTRSSCWGLATVTGTKEITHPLLPSALQSCCQGGRPCSLGSRFHQRRGRLQRRPGGRAGPGQGSLTVGPACPKGFLLGLTGGWEEGSLGWD